VETGREGGFQTRPAKTPKTGDVPEIADGRRGRCGAKPLRSRAEY
jgi:hypothetical protein